jgi:hypothetical protein
VFQDQLVHPVQDMPLLNSLRETVVPTTEFDISHAAILVHHALLFHKSFAEVGCSSIAGTDPGEA